MIFVVRTVPLHADAWADYFRAVRRECERVFASVTLRLDSIDRNGASAAVERALRSIRYDPNRDVLELSVGGFADRGPALRYFISVPRQVVVHESPEQTLILIEDSRRERTAIALRRAGIKPDPTSASKPVDVAVDLPRAASTHFVDRTTWRLTCPHRRPMARRTCRTYMRGGRRGTI